VEDDTNAADNFIEVVKSYYVRGSVKIFVAHAYDAAVSFFENEAIDLVIMDADLDDEDGDGVSLTQQFLKQKPELTILANSSSKISNLKLTGSGAKETLGKNPEKLKSWLLLHDPAGAER
jgi:DNA-binding response OmpR family regulator